MLSQRHWKSRDIDSIYTVRDKSLWFDVESASLEIARYWFHLHSPRYVTLVWCWVSVTGNRAILILFTQSAICHSGLMLSQRHWKSRDIDSIYTVRNKSLWFDVESASLEIARYWFYLHSPRYVTLVWCWVSVTGNRAILILFTQSAICHSGLMLSQRHWKSRDIDSIYTVRNKSLWFGVESVSLEIARYWFYLHSPRYVTLVWCWVSVTGNRAILILFTQSAISHSGLMLSQRHECFHRTRNILSGDISVKIASVSIWNYGGLQRRAVCNV